MYRRIEQQLSRMLAICLLCLLLAACDQQKQSPAPAQPEPHRPTLLIGLIPEQDLFAQKKRYQPLLDHLAAETGVAIEIKLLSRYGNIVDNFTKLGLDGAFFGSFTGAMAIRKLGVEPLARPLYKDGLSTYYGMVFVRKERDIRTAQDLRGLKLVFVDKATTAGYLLPLAYFKSLGIDDYAAWFKEYYFSGNHEDAIRDVLNGLADIGAAKDTIFYRLAQTEPRVMAELEIIATSPHVPANGLAVRKDLPEDLKRALQHNLLTLGQTPAGRAILDDMNIETFIETSVADYQPVLDYAASIGLDLATYQYSNE